MPGVAVSCERRGDEYRCRVTIGEDPAATHHVVSFGQAEFERLAPRATPEELVSAAFEYLLEREPREQILRDFELDVIGRYFPRWEDAVRQRLQT